jgi:uncharacterized membrane protein
MNLWFIVTALAAVLRATKTESMGMRHITWRVVALCLALSVVTAVLALNAVGQALLILAPVGLALTLMLIGYLGYLCGGLSRL